MKLRTETIIYLFFCLCIINLLEGSEVKLEQERVHLLDVAWEDQVNNPERYNILFRSNRPTDEDQKHFLYDTWIEYMIEAAKDRGIYLSKDQKLYLKVFSLLHEDDETNELERSYFKAHPERGEISVYPIYGTDEDPKSLSEHEIKSRSKDLSWMADPIDNLTSTIHAELNNFEDPENCKGCNVLLVIHCAHGKDRTGEISGAYNLKYKHQTWEEVEATNWEMANTHIKYNNEIALTWFCFHLKYHRNYSLSCKIENTSDHNKVKPALVGWDEPKDDSDDDDDDDGYFIAFYVLLSVFSGCLLILVVVAILAFLIWRLEVFNIIKYKLRKTTPTDFQLDAAIIDDV